MNFTESKFWLDAAQWLCTIALGVTVWLRKPGNDAAAAVAALKTDVDQRMNNYSQRLAETEAHMKHMATSEKLMELEGTVKGVAARMDGIAQGMDTVRNTVARIETFLLSNSKH